MGGGKKARHAKSSGVKRTSSQIDKAAKKSLDPVDGSRNPLESVAQGPAAAPTAAAAAAPEEPKDGGATLWKELSELLPLASAVYEVSEVLGPVRPDACDDGDDTNLDDNVAVVAQSAQAVGERLTQIMRVRGGGCAASKPRAQAERFIQDLDGPPKSPSLAVEQGAEATPEDVKVAEPVPEPTDSAPTEVVEPVAGVATEAESAPAEASAETRNPIVEIGNPIIEAIVLAFTQRGHVAKQEQQGSLFDVDTGAGVGFGGASSAGGANGASSSSAPLLQPETAKSAFQLDKMEAMIADFEKKLDTISDMVGKAEAVISAANTVIEIVGDAVPVFGGAFHALNKILTAVQRADELADDIVEVGRSAVDYLKLLIKVGRKALDMKGEAKREVNDAIAEVISLLDELSEAVGQFGKPGFVRRMWRAGTKAAKTLKSLDGKIRRKIEEIVKLYEWAKMDGIEAMLTKLLAEERTFPMEDEILSKVKELVEARMEEETGETEEDARAALEKDEDANAALESVMKASALPLRARVLTSSRTAAKEGFIDITSASTHTIAAPTPFSFSAICLAPYFMQTTTSRGIFFALSFSFSLLRSTAFSEPAQAATSHPSPHHTRMLT